MHNLCIEYAILTSSKLNRLVFVAALPLWLWLEDIEWSLEVSAYARHVLASYQTYTTVKELSKLRLERFVNLPAYGKHVFNYW